VLLGALAALLNNRLSRVLRKEGANMSGLWVRKAFNIGESVAVVIPAEMVKSMKVEVGDQLVIMEISGQYVIRTMEQAMRGNEEVRKAIHAAATYRRRERT
jgi:antitoxin component of MazEF toxin-antitoxin module